MTELPDALREARDQSLTFATRDPEVWTDVRRTDATVRNPGGRCDMTDQHWTDTLSTDTWAISSDGVRANHRFRRVSLTLTATRRVGWWLRWHDAAARVDASWVGAAFDTLEAALVAAELVNAVTRNEPL